MNLDASTVMWESGAGPAPRWRTSRIRALRTWGVLWAVVLSGGVGAAAAWALARTGALRDTPQRVRWICALAWGGAWTAVTRLWWLRAFYRALAGAVGLGPWPHDGAAALCAGWVFWTAVLWGVLPHIAQEAASGPWGAPPDGALSLAPPPPRVRAADTLPADGTDIGRDARGRPVLLTDRQAATHVLVVGATGSGKTNLLMLLAASVLRRGLALVFVDGKGSADLRARLERLAAAAGRDLRTWSIAGGTHYNPLRHGGPTELRDKLTGAERWTEPHYLRAAERYLGEALAVLRATGRPTTLAAVVELLRPEALKQAIRDVPDAAMARRAMAYVTAMDESARSAVSGLGNRLATLVDSEAGPWIAGEVRRQAQGGSAARAPAADPPLPADLDLLDVAQHGGAALLSLDALRYPGLVAQLGALVLQDLRTVASRRLAGPRDRPCYVVIDEFGVFDGTQVLALLNKGREAGMCCVLAAQDLADLAAAGGGPFVDQVMANANVKAVLRQDVDASARRLSDAVGARQVWRATHAVELGVGTGRGTMHAVREPIVDPDGLKRLLPHEAVVVTKAPELSVRRVRLREAAG